MAFFLAFAFSNACLAGKYERLVDTREQLHQDDFADPTDKNLQSFYQYADGLDRIVEYVLENSFTKKLARRHLQFGEEMSDKYPKMKDPALFSMSKMGKIANIYAKEKAKKDFTTYFPTYVKYNIQPLLEKVDAKKEEKTLVTDKWILAKITQLFPDRKAPDQAFQFIDKKQYSSFMQTIAPPTFR